MQNKKTLLKLITYNWRNWLVVDRQYLDESGVYWENSIYKANKLLNRVKEKSDIDKDLKKLNQELLEFIARS